MLIGFQLRLDGQNIARTCTVTTNVQSCYNSRVSRHFKAPHAFAEKLLSFFGNGWSISIDRVPPSADMAASPLQPLLVTVTRCSQQPQHTQETDGQVDDLDHIDIEDGSDVGAGQQGTSPEPAPVVQLSFEAEAGAVNDEQLADIIKVVLRQQLARTGRPWLTYIIKKLLSETAFGMAS